jgi:hypothetical protein
MKERANYAEIEQKVDFQSLSKRLNALTENDNHRRKTVFDVLDKVRDDIISARRKRKVSYHVLAKELTGAGIPVSEPTLRKYLQAHGVAKKPRKVEAQRKEETHVEPVAVEQEAQPISQSQVWRPQHRKGPRIADGKNL